MKSRYAALLFIGVIGLAACTPRGPGGSSGPSQQDPFTGNGTITSGGGNTIDGRMTEMYQKSIETLPEYKRYVFPILRKLSKGQPDVLVAYLQWAAKTKVWYFVPRKLASLPADRIAMTFTSTEQLALHSEKEVFIDEPAYLAQNDHARAYLLLHELVMGAKLLMKKPPEFQCKILSGVLSVTACRDKLQMNLATSNPDSTGREATTLLNGSDHESVRSMTVYLADSKQAFDGASVAAVRQRLGFHFPWDHLASYVQAEDFFAAIDRTRLSSTKFKTVKSFASEGNQPCHVEYIERYLRLGLGEKGADWWTSEPGLQIMAWVYPDTIRLKSSGVPYPPQSSEIVDLVELRFEYNSDSVVRRTVNDFKTYKYQFYLSRGEQPVVLEYRIIPINVRFSENEYNKMKFFEREEIEIKGFEPFRCIAQ